MSFPLNMESLAWKSRLQVAYTLGIIITLSCPIIQGANILVVPVDGSHWVNMRILIEELKLHGHSITVFYFSKSWYIKEQPDLYQSIVVEIPGFVGNNASGDVMQSLIQKALEALQNGAMLAHHLKLPSVFNIRWLITGDPHFLLAPSPSSYIPIPSLQLTDKMSFLQRTQNVILNIFQMYFSKLFIQSIYNEICHRYLGPDTDIETILLGADVWLIRADFIFEFPRPTMPNIVYIGGFQCKPSKPLAAEFEELIQSSGEHGIIVMSLGTIVNSLPMHITMKIAEAFAQIPQKVIWKHNGKIPPNIGNNTLLTKWIPQNDLLGHPKTRAFIAHGGTNGVYEAIYHGVPVVGMPLLFDQFDNLFKLEIRGAAKVIYVSTMQSTDLLQALNEVINNTSYRDNMQKLSALHRDQPETPLERAIFWIEYVARHKGAAHLRSEFYQLPWYAYYCVDVIFFLLSMLLMFTMLTVLLLKKLCHIAWKKKQKIQ
ncbi:UDP-glucuronosyltransferase 2A2-like isoform X2 [Carcharodon carcharias]|uniref:UDP-glucuronosyltransferase 2A2-like isoform X2 n=1 Tax=Carcharodon carcharias TaxID=13397 RepID=UPI001B7E0117|nr:UDP-glucuronosyltransferase 2A2-like isoform X2 [Carcharodon carcharias]